MAIVSRVLACVVGVAATATAAGSDPLFVTPYLPDRYEDAQKESKVDLSSAGWTEGNAMHSGFFTLDQKLGRNSFFWYSESLDGNKDAPLLLWLQGGPGASSLFGMFTEIGPFSINPGAKVVPRNISWNKHYHMLFIDNPVGTGFSFTEKEEGYVSDMQQVGKDLANALYQFFELMPHLRKNDFYVTGESYAGKYVPACAYTVHMENKAAPADKRINLKGISIGDGALEPRVQFKGFGDLLWHMGMVNQNEREVFHAYENKIQTYLDQQEVVKAFEVFDEMLNADFYPYGSYYTNVTGMETNYFNFQLAPDATPLGGDFVAWLNSSHIRELIHVGGLDYEPENNTVEAHLKYNWMVGVLDMLVPVMENYKVMIYNGQNDVILGPPLTEQLITTLDWSGKQKFNAAKKAVWRLDSKGEGSQERDVAGYATEVGNFKYVVVRGAGHMVPTDQPVRAYDLITRFVEGRSFADKKQLKKEDDGAIIV
eukprot:TRINITY_DN101274_c0_g1_i1.p1 TRINITY_DN101274_c0_g1~~TRINITY_DN101274_c0_g1_i1.p1  ORF type:complete len:507 (+),score=134.61 TRINITY_DN101274_c0_g1_i1:74-1522(+)